MHPHVKILHTPVNKIGHENLEINLYTDASLCSIEIFFLKKYIDSCYHHSNLDLKEDVI